MSEQKGGPLDYAPPAVRRRGRLGAGFLAYLFASYAVGITALVVNIATTPPGGFEWGPGIVVFVVVIPLWLPAAMSLTAIRGTTNLYTVLSAVAFVALFVLAFRFLRRPRG